MTLQEFKSEWIQFSRESKMYDEHFQFKSPINIQYILSLAPQKTRYLFQLIHWIVCCLMVWESFFKQLGNVYDFLIVNLFEFNAIFRFRSHIELLLIKLTTLINQRAWRSSPETVVGDLFPSNEDKSLYVPKISLFSIWRRTLSNSDLCITCASFPQIMQCWTYFQ